MKHILILGSTGLLGNAVSKYFLQKKEYMVTLTYRTPGLVSEYNSIYYDPLISFEKIYSYVDYADYVINCIGVINKNVENNEENTVFLNSLFPHKLSKVCKKYNTKLLHITTDCVYSGKKGNYTENDIHDSLDFYGKSKSIGEAKNCMVLRTSIIGREVHNYSSLIEWAISMKDKEVNGFINHIWNGVTTKQYAECCNKIISDELYEENLFHIFSNKITKYDLLGLFDKKWNLNLNIKKFVSNDRVDRSISTIKNLNKKLNIPSIEEQIEEL